MASLGYVYGLLLGNCGYQTVKRKIYDQSEIALCLPSLRETRDKIINLLSENCAMSAHWI